VKVNPDIFKAYDIRGIYPDDLNEPIAYLIGRAFADYLAGMPEIGLPLRVVVGRDMRLSGPSLHAELLRGLTEQGADVLDIGMVSTDQYYFTCAETGLPGMMVTASHNPKEYNGVKMVKRMPYLLSGDAGIQDLRRLVESEKFAAPACQGQVFVKDFRDAFVERILSIIDVPVILPLKVVVDTGNGMVGPILTGIYKHLPVRLTGLFLEPDGHLPNHGLNPLEPENRAELERLVVAQNADIGFAFDGDGDRFFAIDDHGRFVPGDFLTAIMAGSFLEKCPGAKVIYDVRASWAVADLIRAGGGLPLMERVGHAFIKRRMSEEDAVFAGEVTGHYYFRDFYYADSGILPSLVLLELLSRRGVKLSDLLASLEAKYFISGEINSVVADPKSKIEALAQHYSAGEQHRLDGISVTYPTWHFNVRGSNTEPLVRLNLESIRSLHEMAEKRDEVLEMIRRGE
jgi:phosphomannomutase